MADMAEQEYYSELNSLPIGEGWGEALARRW